MIKRTIRIALLTVYLLILFRITVFRSGWYDHELCSGTVLWVPFQTIFTYLTNGYAGLFLWLFIGNIIWFVPFGAYLRLRGLPFWKAVLLTAALSVLIETLQFVFGSGCTETEDVILNTAGGALGCAFVDICRKLRKKALKNPSE